MGRSQSRSPLRREYRSPPTDPRIRRHRSPPLDPRIQKHVVKQRSRENGHKESNHKIKEEPKSPSDKSRIIKREVQEGPRIQMGTKFSWNFRIPKVKHEVEEEPSTKVKYEPEDRFMGTHLEGRIRRVTRDYSPRRNRDRLYEDDDDRSHSLMSITQVKQELDLTRDQLKKLNYEGFWEWRNEDEERECLVCKVSMTGFEPWNAHLNGRKHRNNMKKYGIIIIPPEKQEEAEVEEELKELSDSEAPHAEKTSTGIQYRCQICDVPVNDLTIYKSHINGQKHKKRKNQLGTTGIGVAEDMCPVCRLTLKQRCFACVAAQTECEVHVGRCKHKVHKCCLVMPLLNGKCPLCPNIFEAVEAEFYESQRLSHDDDSKSQNDDVIYIKTEGL
uniref:C2H2-type domain-containing protein n=1 Tax=Acrobeloides nanus TaxID=290746 RepID=A0A914CS71_9BILA